jgi:hypothetical protein
MSAGARTERDGVHIGGSPAVDLARHLLRLGQLSPFSSSFGVKVFSAALVAAVSFSRTAPQT